MNVQLTDEHREVRATAQAAVAEVIGPQASDLDATGRFPVETFQALGVRGLLGLSSPRTLG
jgi:alkylation response protein AidB-like acyl-CoA dehydrogenase